LAMSSGNDGIIRVGCRCVRHGCQDLITSIRPGIPESLKGIAFVADIGIGLNEVDIAEPVPDGLRSSESDDDLASGVIPSDIAGRVNISNTAEDVSTLDLEMSDRDQLAAS
jgi:hypothetical protein